MHGTAKRILVAEDNPGLAHVLRFHLERAGFAVVVANHGGQAWELAQQEKFDMVITDHEMPQVTGVELCALLRESPDYKSTPIVMVTARELELDVRDLEQQLDLTSILQKPYSPNALIQTVESALQGIDAR